MEDTSFWSVLTMLTCCSKTLTPCIKHRSSVTGY